ncbi:MAG: hypothetical protein HOV81_36940 [Kofleriaceae bacterium]|nr:hypothetical protein [Kofleriaceae bacterium]
MRRWLLVSALVCAWLWWRGGDHTSHDAEQQAAVLPDGFALLDGHRVVEVDRQGKQRKEHALTHDDELRLVGTAGGPVAGWVESKKLKLVHVATGKDSVWGKSARMLCQGTATNDERFAVGWLEADDTVWFVHGDTQRRSSELAAVGEPLSIATTDRKGWCGIASAKDLIALFWRDRDRLFIATCTRKKCSGLPASVALGREETLLGFGCVRDACLLAARDRSKPARLLYVTESGATKWTKPLATNVAEVSIVGAGDRAFAVGFVGEAGSEVVRVDRTGNIAPVWKGPSAKHAPALAWSRDQLLVGAGAPVVVGLPR